MRSLYIYIYFLYINISYHLYVYLYSLLRIYFFCTFEIQDEAFFEGGWDGK